MEKIAGSKRARRNGGFELGGKKFDVSCTPLTVKKIVGLLSKARRGLLFTTTELRENLGYTPRSFFAHSSCNQQLEPYRQRVRFPSIMLVWGSRATIRDLRKHKEILA